MEFPLTPLHSRLFGNSSRPSHFGRLFQVAAELEADGGWVVPGWGEDVGSAAEPSLVFTVLELSDSVIPGGLLF